MEYYSAIKKNEMMPFTATWRDMDMIILSEVRQRNTNIISLICRILQNWYKWIYLQNRNRLTDLENRLIVTKGERGVGINKKQIDDKILLYSTWNYIQNPVINHKEKNIKKEYI